MMDGSNKSVFSDLLVECEACGLEFKRIPLHIGGRDCKISTELHFLTCLLDDARHPKGMLEKSFYQDGR